MNTKKGREKSTLFVEPARCAGLFVFKENLYGKYADTSKSASKTKDQPFSLF